MKAKKEEIKEKTELAQKKKEKIDEISGLLKAK